MKITKDPILDSWELAESDMRKRPIDRHPSKACDHNRVLIVDDEESVVLITSKVLKASLPDNIMIETAQNGEEAVSAFAKWHHKVIILDLIMPVMDGEQAANAIIDMCAESNWEVPSIIFRTGYAPPGDIRNLVASDPAHCLLRKPVRNQTLIMAVNKRLGLPS
jgi:CheY-like chemotaxis protein